MGNSQPKYINQIDAVAIFGNKKWETLKAKLECGNPMNAVDFQTFDNIIRSKFSAMPVNLVESLFLAICNDLDGKVEIDLFLSTLAILKTHESHSRRRFTLKVYDKGHGRIHRSDFESTLKLVYDSTFESQKNTISATLDILFGKNDREMLLKDLEQRDVNFGILEYWIVSALSVFLDQPPKNLLKQYKKLSALYHKPDEISYFEGFTISKEIFNSLKNQFSSLCGFTTNLLTLQQWRSAMKYSVGSSSISTYFILPQLSDWIFLARTETYRSMWRYHDFFQFCTVFGFKNAIEKAHYFTELLRLSHDQVFPRYDANNYSFITNWISADHMEKIAPKYISIVSSLLFLVCCLSADISNQRNLSDTSSKGLADREKDVNVDCFNQLAWKKLQKDGLKAVNNDLDSLKQSRPILFDLLSKTVQSIVEKMLDSSIEGKDIENEVWKQIELFLQGEVHSFHTSASRKYSLPTFPGLVDLKTTCNLRFLLPPLSAREEKECIMECILKHMSFADCAFYRPHGKPGTQWAVIDKTWYDTWQIHVGSLQHQSQMQQHYDVVNISENEGDLKKINTPNLNDRIHVGPISNNNFVASSSKSLRLLPDLLYGVDIEFIPPVVFSALQKWYGGGPMILRESVKVIDGDSGKCASDKGNTFGDNGRFEVDLYPLRLTLITLEGDSDPNSFSTNATRSVLISKYYLVDDLIKQLALDSNLATDRVRVSILPQLPKKIKISSNPDILDVLLQADGRTLQDWGCVDGSILLLEKQNEANQSWPRSHSLDSIVSANSVNNVIQDSDSVSSMSVNELSVIDQKQCISNRNFIPKGLDNLGNTCYLNASLQALVHIPILTHYFTSGKYLSNLNTQNVMGYGGRLAVAFAKIVGELLDKEVPLPNPELLIAPIPREERPTKAHSSAMSSLSQSLNYISSSTTSYLNKLGSNVSGIPYSSVSPRDLHHCISLLREQFSGHEQHDAHELLMFLLEGLTEDLCFVSKKPYIVHPDSNDTPVIQLADIWWDNHLKREKSFITSLCGGQFHSVLQCETCGFCSQRFEAFTVLPLPIPEDTTRDIIVSINPWRLRNNTRVTIQCDRGDALIDALRSALTSFVKQLLKNEEISIGIDQKSSVYQFSELLSSLSQSKDTIDRTNGLNLWLCRYWIPTEVKDSTVRAFIGLQRKMDSIKDFSLVVFFNTMLPWHKSQYEKSFYSSLSCEIESTVCHLQTLWVSVMADSTDTEYSLSMDETALFASISKPSTLVLSSQSNDISADQKDENKECDEFSVRVAFQHRQALFAEGVRRNMCGFDNFRLHAFATPILEVLPNSISGSALYQIASMRFATFFKTSSTEELNRYIENSNRDMVNANKISRSTRSSLTEKDSNIENDFEPSVAVAESEKRFELFSASKDDIFAGPMNRCGFTLRLISGGTSVGSKCSRCHWLSDCDGCVIPNNNNVTVTLCDGETIAVDWHYVFVREMLDVDKLSSPGSIPVIGESSTSNILSKYKVALRSCFEKFRERQPLTDVLCSSCTKKADTASDSPIESKLYQTIQLWRVPPLLIIQLKRFQFDRSSRRKLHTHVDFPLSDMNLSEFMSEEAQSLNSNISHSYHLVSVVHHVGALGGGHYLNTSLDQSLWFLYNDHVVTKVKDPSEVVAPSAYLLFYLRSDLSTTSVHEFLKVNNLLSDMQTD